VYQQSVVEQADFKLEVK